MFPPSFGRFAAAATGGALVAAACAAPALVDRRPPRRAPEPDLKRAAAAPATPGAHVTDADRVAGIRWKLDAGSPIHASPAVGPDGTVYVGTGDGYLFAIGAEGVLAWSYTLEGAVAWAPVVDPSGRIYVATAAQHLYSLLPGGSLAWQARTPARVGTELDLAPGGVVFGADDGSIWLYSEHGTPAFHVELGAPSVAGPRIFDHRTVIATPAELVVLEGAVRRRRIPLPARCEAVLSMTPDGSTTVVVGGALVGLGPDGSTRFRRDGITWASAAGDGFLAVEGGETLLGLGPEGSEVFRAALGGRVAAPPVLAPSGAIYAPGEGGGLAVIAPGGASVRWIAVARAALHRPVIDAPRKRVVVSAGNGVVAVVRLEE